MSQAIPKKDLVLWDQYLSLIWMDQIIPMVVKLCRGKICFISHHVSLFINKQKITQLSSTLIIGVK